MPQISQLAETFASQLFWLLVTFGFVFFVVGKMMLPKVMSTVDARDQSVAGDLAAAEAARAAADQAEENWRVKENAAREAAQRRIAEARAQGVAAAEKTLAAGNLESETRIAEAETRIAAASAAAAAEIETVAAEAARDIVARFSGAQVTAVEAQTAVKAALNG
ncbi:F0F1 ATP synthase subunit B family protein [Sphingomonas sp. M1-B02]|uniref:F0F1 ATP synthase subunit B family protein n=1 Tax=Sphingomonas sp. M1-B02 TaxID=3114300 RepID=UPI00223EB007|nr:ATPase [Sphingomonas sp. S6-11]UZK65987.1 ATPase [Sphingomonas sp. S6-11]